MNLVKFCGKVLALIWGTIIGLFFFSLAGACFWFAYIVATS